MARAAKAVADDIEEPEHEPTLRETIESARDDIAAREVAEAAGEGGAGEGAAAGSGDVPNVGAPGELVRDEHGRFTRREVQTQGTPQTDSASASGGSAPAATGTSGAQPAAASPAPAASTLLAPQGWTPGAKAKWAALPEDIRAEITRREADMHRTITRQDQERDMGRQFAEVAQAHQDIIGRSGVTPARFFGDVMGAMRTLQGGDPAQKAGLIRDLIMRNQVDARLIFPNPNAPAPQPGAQPGPAVIPQPVMQMANEWNQFKTERAREAQEREQRQQQEILDEIVAFRSKPEARFFDAVNDQMVALLQGGIATSVEEAYNQAIWTRPDIRAVLAQEETQARAQAEQKRLAALNARRKGGSVKGGVGSASTGEAPNRSLREELQANFADARSRV